MLLCLCTDRTFQLEKNTINNFEKKSPAMLCHFEGQQTVRLATNLRFAHEDLRLDLEQPHKTNIKTALTATMKLFYGVARDHRPSV